MKESHFNISGFSGYINFHCLRAIAVKQENLKRLNFYFYCHFFFYFKLFMQVDFLREALTDDFSVLFFPQHCCSTKVRASESSF